VCDRSLDIDKRSVEGGLPCLAAFSLAKRWGITPVEVREEADRKDTRICFCQLGLFGYQAFGDKRLAATMARVPDRLAEALQDASEGGALSCAAAWRIADREGLPRPVVGSAADALGIRIGPCQLGCF